MSNTPDEIVDAFAKAVLALTKQYGFACAVSVRVERIDGTAKLYAFSNTTIPHTEFLFAQALAQVTTNAPSGTLNVPLRPTH